MKTWTTKLECLSELLRSLKQAALDLAKRKASIIKRKEQKELEAKKQEAKMRSKAEKDEAKKTVQAAKAAEKARASARGPTTNAVSVAWACFSLDFKHHIEVPRTSGDNFKVGEVDWALPFYVDKVQLWDQYCTNFALVSFTKSRFSQHHIEHVTSMWFRHPWLGKSYPQF